MTSEFIELNVECFFEDVLDLLLKKKYLLDVINVVVEFVETLLDMSLSCK